MKQTEEFIFNLKNMTNVQKVVRRLSQVSAISSVFAREKGLLSSHETSSGRTCYILEANINDLNQGYMNRYVNTIDFLLPASHKNTFEVYTLQIFFHTRDMSRAEKIQFWEKSGEPYDEDRLFMAMEQKFIDNCKLYKGKQQIFELKQIDDIHLSQSARKHNLTEKGGLFLLLQTEPAFQPIKNLFFTKIFSVAEQKRVLQITETIRRKMRERQRTG